jgi:acetyl esterase/lipase
MIVKKDVGPDCHHLMDIYNDAQNVHGTVLMIHGGGWHFQSKSAMVGQAYVFAEQGYRVVCVSYPLLSFTFQQMIVAIMILTLIFLLFVKHELLWIWLILVGIMSEYWSYQPWLTVQDQVEAIKVQLQWVRDTYTNSKITIVGYSCGAHLGAMVAHQTYGVIDCCILISGVYDKSILCELMGGSQLTLAGVDDFPTNYAAPVSTRFLLMNASCDLNLKKQTYVYYHKLYEAGVYVKAMIVPDTNHWTVHRRWSTTRSWVRDAVLEFMNDF